MPPIAAIACLLGSYLLGSVSWAFLLVRWRAGQDLREVGSGNLGATNASRVLGRRWGVAIYALDMLKGLIPALVGRIVLGDRIGEGPLPLGLAMGLSAFCGHCFPVWFRFRGGKGVATASGAILGTAPVAVGIAVAVFAALLLSTRMISAGSLGAAAVLPVAHWIMEAAEAPSWSDPRRITFLLVTAVALAVIALHRSNLARILNGTERRIGRPRGDGETS